MTKRLRILGRAMCAFAILTWLIPATGWGAERKETYPSSPASRPIVRDVALGQNGSMTGQLVDAQGRARSQQIVVAQRSGAEPIQTRTDANGRFQFTGLTGGTYQVATTDAALVCRCWTDQAAPPAAQRELLLVAGQGVQRGQHAIGDLLFSAPVLITLVIAAAIAIPIAIHNSQDSGS